MYSVTVYKVKTVDICILFVKEAVYSIFHNSCDVEEILQDTYGLLQY